ncbi:MAG: heparinase II/III family protein [Planctomycetes bacterium]|nr:heparinase II/III family protein [Planctomycetota bacterium]
MLRTDWTRDAVSVFAACRTPVNNGHAHIDPCGFDLTAFGTALVVDPGRFTYSDGPARRRYRSATWHNCLTMLDREPFAMLSSWSYGPQREGRVLGVGEVPGLMWTVMRHENYHPAIHWRCIALVDERVIMVIDRIDDGAEAAPVRLHFHVASERVEWRASERFAITSDPGANIAIAASIGTGEILPGGYSPLYDIERPGRRLRLSDESRSPDARVYATALIPFAGAPPAVGRVDVQRQGDAIVAAVEIAGASVRVRWNGMHVSRA